MSIRNPILVAGCVASLAVLLFAVSLGGSVDEATARDAEETAGFFPKRTYYRGIRPDLRRCPSPQCGGVFIERVNQKRTACGDGSVAEECRVLSVDWKALGLEREEEAEIDAAFATGEVIVRGRLQRSDLGLATPVIDLVVQDAWALAGGSDPTGSFFGAVSTGVVCITSPCPSFEVQKLNRRRGPLDFDAVDLDNHTGATPEQIAEGQRALGEEGLVVAGHRIPIRGPAGRGLDLIATAFYSRVGAACGKAICSPGLVCCNPLQGLCARPDEACVQ